ncbi:MAG: hypothetical protein AW09_002573 [Candidatus Accumulibacter phosphatis]|uniref:Uncharacterized protein n=1 Tax=Candidatus Accumulibacter phosphatis TaxID=327160 RepID=A0A080LUM5_9PROT|nr:MAG: hypothetical protein AW09_002573 [Candidatus Accumulibacter phosphatis]
MHVMAAESAADETVCVTHAHHHRAEQRGATPYFAPGKFGRNPFALHQTPVFPPVRFEVLVEKFVVVGVDDVEVNPRRHAQVQRLKLAVDVVRVTDQNRPRDSFVNDHLHGTQHAIVFPFSENDASGCLLGLREDRFHDQAEVIDEFVQTFPIGFEILDGPARHPGCHGRLGNRRRNLANQAWIERIRNQILRSKVGVLFAIRLDRNLRLLDSRQFGDRPDCGQLHRFGNGGRADIKSTAKNEGKAQHVVDLVRVIRTASRNDRIVANRLHVFGPNFRIGIRQCHDQWCRRHSRHHLLLEDTTSRQPEEDVGTLDDFPERPCIGALGITPLDFVHVFDAALIDQTLDVGYPDVLDRNAQHHQQVQAGECSGAGPRGDQLDLMQFLALQEQTIENSRADDDCRAVLIVVKDRNLHSFAQFLLDMEALRRLDVFQVDATKSRFQGSDDFHQAIGIALLDFQVENVDIGELLEQHGLAFHHRFGGQRADRSEAKYRGTIGDDADQVGARGQRARFAR